MSDARRERTRARGESCPASNLQAEAVEEKHVLCETVYRVGVKVCPMVLCYLGGTFPSRIPVYLRYRLGLSVGALFSPVFQQRLETQLSHRSLGNHRRPSTSSIPSHCLGEYLWRLVTLAAAAPTLEVPARELEVWGTGD
jgi:hypothetical protein